MEEETRAPPHPSATYLTRAQRRRRRGVTTGRRRLGKN